MKASQYIFVVGSFLTSFGAFVMISEVPSWAWWTGKAMVILGPLLTTSIVMARRGEQPHSTPSTPTENEKVQG